MGATPQNRAYDYLHLEPACSLAGHTADGIGCARQGRSACPDLTPFEGFNPPRQVVDALSELLDFLLGRRRDR